jgi:hypothetical protein
MLSFEPVNKSWRQELVATSQHSSPAHHLCQHQQPWQYFPCISRRNHTKNLTADTSDGSNRQLTLEWWSCSVVCWWRRLWILQGQECSQCGSCSAVLWPELAFRNMIMPQKQHLAASSIALCKAWAHTSGMHCLSLVCHSAASGWTNIWSCLRVFCLHN